MNKKYIVPSVTTREISLQCAIMSADVNDVGNEGNGTGPDLGAPTRLYI